MINKVTNARAIVGTDGRIRITADQPAPPAPRYVAVLFNGSDQQKMTPVTGGRLKYTAPAGLPISTRFTLRTVSMDFREIADVVVSVTIAAFPDDRIVQAVSLAPIADAAQRHLRWDIAFNGYKRVVEEKVKPLIAAGEQEFMYLNPGGRSAGQPYEGDQLQAATFELRPDFIDDFMQSWAGIAAMAKLIMYNGTIDSRFFKACSGEAHRWQYTLAVLQPFLMLFKHLGIDGSGTYRNGTFAARFVQHLIEKLGKEIYFEGYLAAECTWVTDLKLPRINSIVTNDQWEREKPYSPNHPWAHAGVTDIYWLMHYRAGEDPKSDDWIKRCIKEANDVTAATGKRVYLCCEDAERVRRAAA